MQPEEFIPTAQPVVTTTPAEEALLAELRIFFVSLDAICARDKEGLGPKTVNEQRFELRKLRERLAAALTRRDKARTMERVPEGGDA